MIMSERYVVFGKCILIPLYTLGGMYYVLGTTEAVYFPEAVYPDEVLRKPSEILPVVLQAAFKAVTDIIESDDWYALFIEHIFKFF